VRQVVVFGDSLSDVGTYKVGPVAQVGGGRFTTNPGLAGRQRCSPGIFIAEPSTSAISLPRASVPWPQPGCSRPFAIHGKTMRTDTSIFTSTLRNFYSQRSPFLGS